MLPTFADVEAAAAALAPYAIETPLVEHADLNERVGARVFLKLETFQRTGSFKFRGAINRIRMIRWPTAPEASWRSPPATMRKVSLPPPSCSAFRRSSSCRKTPRRPSWRARAHTVPRSSSMTAIATTAKPSLWRFQAGAAQP